MRPVVIARRQRLFDQQPAKAGAIDEHITRNRRIALHDQCRHIAVFAVTRDRRDLPLDPLDPARHGKLAQERSIKPGIEMECIGHFGQHLGRSRWPSLHPPHECSHIVQ